MTADDTRDRPATTSSEKATRPMPTLTESLGGPWGMAESSLPALAFVVAYTASGQDTRTSAIVAVVLATLLTVVRLVRRETPRHALSGLIGVAFAAFIAVRTGRAENYFVPGFFLNAGYAAAFVISILVRRPLVGVLVGQIDGSGMSWRSDPARRRLYARASWLWVAMFLSRLIVQLPLYLAESVVALGVARTAMGVPLFALTLWVTYRWVWASRQRGGGGRAAPAPGGLR